MNITFEPCCSNPQANCDAQGFTREYYGNLIAIFDDRNPRTTATAPKLDEEQMKRIGQPTSFETVIPPFSGTYTVRFEPGGRIIALVGSTVIADVTFLSDAGRITCPLMGT